MNKESVRTEVAHLKSELDRLCDEGKVSSEIKMLMRSMFMIIDLILSIFLEKTTKKNSANSSIPPSQTEPDDSSLDQQGSNKKGKVENQALSANTRTRESVTTLKASACHVCGEDLSDVHCEHHERRTKIDIVFEKVVEHTDAEVKQCPNCDVMVKGKFPADLHGALQYGNGLKAFMINLLVSQMVSLNRIQKLVTSLVGSVIAEASLLKWVMQLHDNLEDWEHAATKEILKAPAINVDETSLRVDKQRHWIHVYAAGDITLKFLHRKRGLEAINVIDIIPRYEGVIIHDCWSSYLSFSHCLHGLCGSHILRELTFVFESNDYRWALNMKRLLQETCKTVSMSEHKELTAADYAKLQKRFRTIITRGEKELPAIPPKANGKRGKIAKSDAHNLLERLKKYESAVLLFAKNSHVSFTNNRAERDLRMAKVKQKVSGCFRAQRYAKAYCRISSYLQTMANKGYNPLIAIQMAMAGDINTFKG